MTTTALKPISIANQMQVKANGLHVENAKKIMTLLEIKWSAIVIREEVIFMLRNGMDGEQFLQDHFFDIIDDNKKSMKLLRLLSKERQEMIDRTRFESFSDFMNAYEENAQKAMERLFMEPFNQGRARYIPHDLMTMFHVMQEHPYYRFGRLIEIM